MILSFLNCPCPLSLFLCQVLTYSLPQVLLLCMRICLSGPAGGVRVLCEIMVNLFSKFVCGFMPRTSFTFSCTVLFVATYVSIRVCFHRFLGAPNGLSRVSHEEACEWAASCNRNCHKWCTMTGHASGGSVAVAIVPWTLLMLFNACWLRYFYNCMCVEFGVSLRLLWHVPGSQRRLLAVMELTLQFQIPSLLGTVLFKYSLGTC